MTVPCLRLDIYKNPLFEKCSNGGISERFDEVFLICPDGPHKIEDDDPRLVRLEGDKFSGLHLVPLNGVDDSKKTVGPMMGGAYATTSDHRLQEMCITRLGHSFYGAIALHDRWETPEQYWFSSH